MIESEISSKAVEKFLDDFKKLMNDKYVGIKEYDRFLLEHQDMKEAIKKENIDKSTMEKIDRIFNDKKALLKNNNMKYLDRKLIEYQDYFDNMFKNVDPNIKLDINQRQAIIADEDNLLIVAGAGSGKTTTMAAKVKYLIEKCNVKQSEIAVISFTNKAKDEIADRIQKKFGFNNVDIYTFHQLGYKIIRQVRSDIVSIIDDGGKYKIISNYIKNILFKDKDLFLKFDSAFKNKTHFDSEWKDFDSFKQYHDYKYQQKYDNSQFDLEKYIDSEISKRLNYRKSIRGEYLKSKEEVEIANFLYLNGIDYEYEKTYDKTVGDKKSYSPDFYISELDKINYIEHFGVDENYYNSKYTKQELINYLNNMKLKIKFHNEVDNYKRFIVTYSRYKDKKSLIEHLKEALINNGYSLTKRDSKEVFDLLRDTSEDGYFAEFIDKLCIPFISLFKSQNLTDEDFKILRIKAEKLEIENQIDILKGIYNYYQNQLIESHKIDFEDMINEAYRIMPKLKESDLGIDYNYVIIDEYQDISSQRYNLTKQISDLFDAKIMAVGDDWQSIFGFAGAEINLFTDFKDFFEGAKSIPIVNTYRNSQELIDVAYDFITKNKSQLSKKLISMKHQNNPIEIITYDDEKKFASDFTKPLALSMIIGKIYSEQPNSKILIMGRYKSDVKSILKSNLFRQDNREKITCLEYPHADITYLTIHSSKGLGFDNCILLNATNERFGFPSRIEDEPVIKLIKPEIKEQIDYPEERRLFYVAMTRTKNKLYITVPKTNASSFIKEISNEQNVLVYHEIVTIDKPIKTAYICPDRGYNLEMVNYHDTNYYIYECENNCGFRTTMPKKMERINNCPKCGEIVTYRDVNTNGNKIYKCFNSNCNYTEVK